MFKMGFKIILEGHKIIHAYSMISITPIYSDFGVETRYINKFLKEVATIYARFINQKKIKYHTLFSASFFKINE